METVDWGRTRYADALERQLAHVERRLAGEVGDELIFTEHEAVYTLGLRAGADAHLVWDDHQRAAAAIEVVRTNRGGDITYHGPGQLVGYPIVDLSARKDLHAYLRFLEDVLVASVSAFGVKAHRRAGLTGIWVGSRKLAAIGVAVRRWVAYHGFALNVAPDLAHFGGIIPCGINAGQGTVTSLVVEAGRNLSLPEVQQVVAREFLQHWPEFLSGAPTC
jgi:lipoyl(octanoyl) transferase